MSGVITVCLVPRFQVIKLLIPICTGLKNVWCDHCVPCSSVSGDQTADPYLHWFEKCLVWSLCALFLGFRWSNCWSLFALVWKMSGVITVCLVPRFQVIKLLIPIWAMLYAFQPNIVNGEQEHTYPGYSEDGVSTHFCSFCVSSGNWGYGSQLWMFAVLTVYWYPENQSMPGTNTPYFQAHIFPEASPGRVWGEGSGQCWRDGPEIGCSRSSMA